MGESSIGEQELALLRHIADHGSVTVGEAADAFGVAARPGTVDGADDDGAAAVKGHLGRRMSDGVYRYRARASSAELLKSAVQRFVERNLDGSVSPFLAYLSEAGRLSDAELRELEALVARLHAGRGKDR